MIISLNKSLCKLKIAQVEYGEWDTWQKDKLLTVVIGTFFFSFRCNCKTMSRLCLLQPNGEQVCGVVWDSEHEVIHQLIRKRYKNYKTVRDQKNKQEQRGKKITVCWRKPTAHFSPFCVSCLKNASSFLSIIQPLCLQHTAAPSVWACSGLLADPIKRHGPTHLQNTSLGTTYKMDVVYCWVL